MQPALKFIVLMGIVSLLGDTVYEGARGVIGTYLATLGATAFYIGILMGLGELIGYSLRMAFGYLSDKTRAYWFFTFAGYTLILSIPLISFFDEVGIVSILILAERIGKGIRSPPRDTLISLASKKFGRGISFGLHEALDQIGALIGPFIFFVVLYLGFGYKVGFAILFIPAILMLIFLYLARLNYPEVETPTGVEKAKLDKNFWYYLVFTVLSTAGLANFQLIAYHIKLNSIFSDEIVPILYSAAMGVDAISALISGRFYDRSGLKTLVLVPILTFLSVFLAFGYNPIAGIILFGIVMGMQESVIRAAVADIVKAEKRATAYGIFHSGVGFGFFIGGAFVGYFYEFSIDLVLLYSLIVELLAVAFLVKLLRNF